ncbi:MAG: MBL fold metallo-hydrolase [Clostridia bacterium]|nr:MBL fold metallo-hydrolase [Clostridia bacterium]
MKIEYLGHSCFLLTSAKGVRVLTDPYTKVGYELPQGLQADIITVSHGHFDHNYTQAVCNQPIILDTVEDFTQGEVEIHGEESFHDPKQGALRGKNIIFKITMDGIVFCHFGDLGEAYNNTLKDKLQADVWLLPVGGTYTIDPVQAKEYIEKCQPKLVIPMHYKPLDGALDIQPSSAFLNGCPWRITEFKNGEISLTKENLQKKSTQILYMERKKSE